VSDMPEVVVEGGEAHNLAMMAGGQTHRGKSAEWVTCYHCGNKGLIKSLIVLTCRKETT
jgi:hypothetical protein